MWIRRQKLDTTYLSIVVLAVCLYVGYDRLIAHVSTGTARETISSAIGVIFVIITTMYMLNKQTEVERKKELNNEIFKKKLEVYEKAIALWQRIGFIDDEINQSDRAACLEAQLNLMMIAPTDVAKCATEITATISSVYQAEDKTTLDQSDKDILFRQLDSFAKIVRADLDLPHTSLDLDPELVSEMKATVVAASKTTRNYDKYEFSGEVYGKGRLVLAVVQKVAKERNVNSFDDLETLFPKSWQSLGKIRKSKQAGVVFSKEDADQNELRHFSRPDEVIQLTNGDCAVVNNQWGVDNVEYFIEQAKSALGVEVARTSSK